MGHRTGCRLCGINAALNEYAQTSILAAVADTGSDQLNVLFLMEMCNFRALNRSFVGQNGRLGSKKLSAILNITITERTLDTNSPILGPKMGIKRDESAEFPWNSLKIKEISWSDPDTDVST